MKSNRKNITLYEAFAGIGSQYKALKNISSEMNWNVKLVGMIEWFIPAIIAHYAIHFGVPNVENYSDFKYIYIYILNKLSNDSKKPISDNYLNSKILNSQIIQYIVASHKLCNNSFDVCSTKYSNISKNLDIFTYSFPCQDLSIQGKQRGMSKDSKTRSSLLWEIERIFIELSNNYSLDEMPKYLLMENVSQVANQKNINELRIWQNQLKKLGYESKLYILNAKDFGLPQNRSRAFLLSISKYWLDKTNFIFPNFFHPKKNKKIKDILSSNVSNDLFLDHLNKYETSILIKTKSNIQRKTLINYTNFNCENYIYSVNGIGPTLTATGANSRIKIFDNENRIRYLSNLENFLYMGFDKNDYQKVVNCNLVSPQKQTFLCGNSIAVPVLEEIFKSLKF